MPDRAPPLMALEPRTEGSLRRWPHARPVVVCLAGIACLIAAASASGAESVAREARLLHFPAAQIFTFLFLMLGPFKIIGPFSKITKGADAAATRRIAMLATGFASLALLVAAFLGEGILNSYRIPVPVLALSAGLILFLVALQGVLQQFLPPTSHGEGAPEPSAAPVLNAVLTPLAFPTIVTPYGIAALIVFLALSPDLESKMTIGAIVVAIMLLNLVVMIVARRVLHVLGVVLPILGAVLGVVQVALGLQIIHSSLKALGIL